MRVSQCASSKLTQNKPMLTTVTSFYANPYSRTTYANDVKNQKFDAGTTPILNIGYASYSRGNYTPKKPNANDVKKCAGRTYVRGSPYPANLHTRCGILRKRHLAANVNIHLRSDGVLRCTPVGFITASGVSCFVNTKQRYAEAKLKLRGVSIDTPV